MATIAIPVALTHEGFGAIILAFDEAVGEASRQKIKEGQDFSSPITKGGESFAHLRRAIVFDGGNPGIQACLGSRGRSGGIPSA